MRKLKHKSTFQIDLLLVLSAINGTIIPTLSNIENFADNNVNNLSEE